MKSKHLGFRQLTFDFDESHSRDSEKVLSYIHSRLTGNASLMLDLLSDHFHQAENWPEKHTMELLMDLYRDDLILFFINGDIVSPENIKTHISNPALKSSIEIRKPEIIDKTELSRARNLGEELFGTMGPPKQNDFCRYVRTHLYFWANTLEGHHKTAVSGSYPGVEDIKQILSLTEKLLNMYDPFEFLKTFLENETFLRDAANKFSALKHFYANRTYAWDNILRAVDNFTLHQKELEQDHDAKTALEKLQTIMRHPESYSMIKQAEDLLSTIAPAYNYIIEALTAHEKEKSLTYIDEKIARIRHLLKKRDAGGKLMNKSLRPLQIIRKKILSASTVSAVAGFHEEAAETFEMALEQIDT